MKVDRKEEKKDWKERFADKIKELYGEDLTWEVCVYRDEDGWVDNATDELDPFISDLLHQQRQRTLEEVREGIYELTKGYTIGLVLHLKDYINDKLSKLSTTKVNE